MHCIVTKLSKNLYRALTIARTCTHSGFLKYVFSTINSSQFIKVSNLLESSAGDLRWLNFILDPSEENFYPPPILTSNPTLVVVWTLIGKLHRNNRLSDRIMAAEKLTFVDRQNVDYRKLVIKEGGVSALLLLLKDGAGYSESEIAVTKALNWLIAENDVESCREIVADNNLQIPLLVQVLLKSDVSVQIIVTELISKIVKVDATARKEFGKHDVIKPLISCLIAKNEPYENQYKLKANCALALSRLCEKNLLNCQKISEPESLLCLSKLFEVETGELQLYCLMTIMEVAKSAENDVMFRKMIWEPTSAPVNSVIDQVCRVIREETSPECLIPAIKTIGCLSRIFPAKETEIVGVLVSKLGNENLDVAVEALTGLRKFASSGNDNCVEHSKTIIKFHGVPLMINLMRVNEQIKLDGLVLLSYLCINVKNNRALADSRLLKILDSVLRRMTHDSDFKMLLSRAKYYLMESQDSLYLPISYDFSVV